VVSIWRKKRKPKLVASSWLTPMIMRRRRRRKRNPELVVSI
jgi:hypothetical protein